MEELSRVLDPLPDQGRAPTISSGPTLPKLAGKPSESFLALPCEQAGRAVILQLYAPVEATREERVALWNEHKALDRWTLGLFAQRLERAGYEWRNVTDHHEIIQEGSRLSHKSLH